MKARKDRECHTVQVGEAEWTAYRFAAGADKVLRHVAIFYTIREAPSGLTRQVSHPLLVGRLPYSR